MLERECYCVRVRGAWNSSGRGEKKVGGQGWGCHGRPFLLRSICIFRNSLSLPLAIFAYSTRVEFFPRQMVKLGYAKLRWASHVLYMCALGQIPTIYPLNLNLFARFLVLKLKLSKCQGIKQQKENVQISFTLLLTFTILLNISDWRW